MTVPPVKAGVGQIKMTGVTPFWMSGTFVFACLQNVRCTAGSVRGEQRHLSVHRFLEISMFASFCWIVCCTCLGPDREGVL